MWQSEIETLVEKINLLLKPQGQSLRIVEEEVAFTDFQLYINTHEKSYRIYGSIEYDYHFRAFLIGYESCLHYSIGV